MDKNKILKIIRERIEETKNEYKRECFLHEKDKRYAEPSHTWYDTRVKTFNECLELFSMLDNEHNR